jgi:ABC-type dipeptide/oligopeptide/nickel transport system permease subunit
MADATIPVTVVPTPPTRGAVGRFFHELLRSGTGLFGLGVLVLTALAAIFASALAPYSPTKQDLRNRLQPPIWWGGTTEHILGTDQLGRDLLSRMLFGARVTLFVSLAVVLIAGTVGIVVGLISGYVGGLTDTVIMRVIDTLLAFPGILLALVILYAVGPSVTLLVIVLSINGWMVYARMARGSVLTLRKAEYVEAAEVVGARPARVMFRHLLPNLASPLLTLAVLEFARIILAEAALSFLGYGVQPPKSSWGLMIAQGQNYLSSAWWLVVIPGIAISLTVLASNLFASWLRIYADPRQREKHLGDALAEQAAAAVPPVR